jgi:hypothetical protein
MESLLYYLIVLLLPPFNGLIAPLLTPPYLSPYIPSHRPISTGSNESLRKVTRALISVSDKTGLDVLAPVLAAHGVEILSTGGSASKLRELGLKVMDVAGIYYYF